VPCLLLRPFQAEPTQDHRAVSSVSVFQHLVRLPLF
jgi:hypothetical protein